MSLESHPAHNSWLVSRKGQRGFSIASALVALAVVGVAGMTMMAIMQTTSDTQNTLKIRQEADQTAMIISMLLKNPETCRHSLLGGDKIKLSKIEKKSISLTELRTAKNDLILKKDGPERVSSIVLEPLRKDPKLANASPSLYLAQLSLSFNGGVIAPRTIPITLRVKSGAAVDCNASSGDDEEDLRNDPAFKPHLENTNCRGQYYPFEGKTPPASVSGLSRVSEEKRLALLRQNPPDFVENKANAMRDGFDYSNPTPEVYIHPSIPVAAKEPRVAKIDGTNYLVTPTYENGAHHSTGKNTGIVKSSTSVTCVNGRLEGRTYEGEGRGKDPGSGD